MQHRADRLFGPGPGSTASLRGTDRLSKQEPICIRTHLATTSAKKRSDEKIQILDIWAIIIFLCSVSGKNAMNRETVHFQTVQYTIWIPRFIIKEACENTSGSSQDNSFCGQFSSWYTMNERDNSDSHPADKKSKFPLFWGISNTSRLVWLTKISCCSLFSPNKDILCPVPTYSRILFLKPKCRIEKVNYSPLPIT